MATPPERIRFRWRVLLLTAVFAALLWPKIGSGTLWQHDELLTANRTREMCVRRDPFTLTLNFAPDFKKPPLQYWMCAAAFELFPRAPEVAVRLPSLLQGAACLLAVAGLARRCYPQSGDTLPLCAALAVAGCGYFIHHSRIGLLDTGAALYVTLAVTGCQAARGDPRWWWFVGLQCVLGAWQKAPFAFAAWGIILAVRMIGDAPGTRTGSRHLSGALVASVAAASTWWLLQGVRYGFPAAFAAGWWQAHALGVPHDPADSGFRPYLYWFWLARDWALPGLCAPAAVAVALASKARSAEGKTTPAFELAAVCGAYGVVLALVPFRAERYLIVVTPLLALVTVRWLDNGFGAGRRWLVATALASALPVAAFHYFSRTPANPDLLAVAHDLGRNLSAAETPVVAAGADPTFEVANFVAFYADQRRPLLELEPGQIGGLAAPGRGICSRRQWLELSRACPLARQVSQHGEWIEWVDGRKE